MALLHQTITKKKLTTISIFYLTILNSFIIIGDLLAYDQNRRILEDIAKIANQRNDYQIIERGELEIASSLKIPEIVRQNLLTGEDGLIPRYRIRFLFLVICKGEYSSEDLLDDDIPY